MFGGQRQDLRHRLARVHPAGSDRDDAGVHLEHRQARLLAEEDRDARALAVRRQRTQRQLDRVLGSACLDGDRKRPEALGPRGADDLGAERLGQRAAGLVVVGVDDVVGAQRQRDRHRVQPDRAGGGAADDQDRGARLLAQRRRNRPPRVGDVVRDTGHVGRLEAVGNRHEHVSRIRHEHHVRQEAAPRGDVGAEAIGRHRHDAPAAPRAPAPARVAVATRDLKRDADPLARPQVTGVVADVDHLGHALVPDRERRRERGLAGHDQRVEVARRDRDRADQRGAVGGQHRLGHVAPLEHPGGRVRELPHAAAANSSAASMRSSPQNGIPLTASVGTPMTPWANA